MEEDLKKCRVETPESIDTVFNCVVPYIHDNHDRNSVSLVCRKWCELEAVTRKHVTIRMCYSTTPLRLCQRFPNIESIKLKGRPRVAMPAADMFETVQEDWGGYVTPWVQVIASSFSCFQAVHFKRMIVRDSDLELLAQTHGEQLKVLKIHACSGFSTDGLLHIGKHCNHLKILFLQKSKIVEKDGKWLHELALHSTSIESLNFYRTNLDNYDYKDLVLIAKSCSESLVSLKIDDCDLRCLVEVFNNGVNLEDFGASPFYEPGTRVVLKFPPKLRSMAVLYMSISDIPAVLSFAHQLTELDLIYARFNKDDYCMMIYMCPNLEVLYTKDAIGDIGVQFVGHVCKKLRKIKIETGDDENGLVSHKGLIALAQGCLELECLHIYVNDIENENEALECIGTNLKNLYDFRITSLNKLEKKADSRLDNGVRALLNGCTKLEKLGIYCQPGALTDVGLGYIGEYGRNLRSLLLGFISKSGAGLVELSKGCPKLQKFEMRGLYINEDALAAFALNLTSLRYLWVQVYRFCVTDTGGDTDTYESGDDTDTYRSDTDIYESGGGDIFGSDDDLHESGGDIFGGGGNILAMARPFWNMELIEYENGDNAPAEPFKGYQPKAFSLLGYYSLAGQRTDFPDNIIPLCPSKDLH